MPAYIDKEYYDNEYQGAPFEDIDEFNRTAKRASEVIDQLTNYSIANYDFSRLATFLQEQVKKSCAAQVEYFVLNGGYEAFQEADMQNVSIGSFSYQEGEKHGLSITNENVVSHLVPTGLLYRGVATYG